MLPGLTGFVIPRNDPATYVARLTEMLDDTDLYAAMQQDALRHASSLDQRTLLLQMMETLSLGTLKPKQHLGEPSQVPAGSGA